MERTLIRTSISAVLLLIFVSVSFADGPGLTSVMRSNGAGGFNLTLASPWSDYSLPNGVWLSADLNGDGRVDIVHAVANTDYVHTWISNGDGTFAFGTFRPWAGYGIPNGNWMTADINGDGRTDIVHAVANTDYVHTWISNGNGSFNVGTFRPWAGYGIPNGIWMTADINGDGRTDIVHAVANTDYVHTWISNGNGSFNVGTFRPWAGYGIPNGNWMTADINGDGRTDIVHAVANTDYVHTWISNGNGSFNVGTFRPWAGYRISNGIWLSQDLNNDRRTDLVHIYEIVPGRPLEVSRFNTSTLTNADADRILDDATRVLWRNDGAGDVSCSVRLFRRGNVGTFNNGNGIINSQADYNTITGLAGRVKVVNQINWCSGLIPNVIGCAGTGTSQIIVRFTANQEGILWAHEYGHTRGLGHVAGATSIMNATISPARTMATQNECDSFDN